MVRAKRFFAVAAACCTLFAVMQPVHAQSKARIAIIPFNPIDVSRAEADALTRLLETGIVSTDFFTVIEQTQAADILSAQEFSLKECTDEGCAIKIGKLLSSEQILLGAVSKIGGKYVATAKIIDVTTGKNLKADKVEAQTLDAMTGQMEVLAYMLAGLTFKQGGEVTVAKSFGEVFVQTTPDGADVSVNGMARGKSPLVVNKVPLGKVTIEARKDNQYASQEVELKNSNLVEITLQLKVSLGRIFIRTSDKTLKVFLDDKAMGEVGAGLLKDIASGDHGLALLGDGLAWEGSVTVTADQTVTVEATPREIGIISYFIPEGASMDISTFNYRKVVSGSGKLERVPAGSYDWKAQGTNYKSAEGTIAVKKAATADLRPSLAFSDDYQARLDKEKRDKEYDRLKEKLDRLGRLAESGGVVGEADLPNADALLKAIRAAPYGFKDLEDRTVAVAAALRSRKDAQEEDARRKDIASKLAMLQTERDQLKKDLAAVQTSRAGLSTGGWVSFGTGVASTAGAIASFVLSYLAHGAYSKAGVSADAVKARQDAQFWSTVTIATGGVAGGTMALGGILWLAAPDPGKSETRIADVEKKISDLQGSVK